MSKDFIVDKDTIVACATPLGKGGVAIIRLSGSLSKKIASRICLIKEENILLRHASFVNLFENEESLIDEGLLIYFQKPNSFTGEDVVEFQCHGSPVVVEQIIQQAVFFGARRARPGEFSERAFLNNKIDLTQAEAISDLINSQSKQAAKNAVESLKGKFSKYIESINQNIIESRCFLEASIDFPDEEGVDFIGEANIKEKIQNILETTNTIIEKAGQGLVFQEGIKLVIAGEPNAGKSSLLNALCEKEAAIVTNIAGTTRDTLKENISIKGLPVNLVDTAGLRVSEDLVEQEGIRRAWEEIKSADFILYVYDSSEEHQLFEQLAWNQLLQKLNPEEKTTLNERLFFVENKVDLTGKAYQKETLVFDTQMFEKVALSAKENLGLKALENLVFEKAGLSQKQENGFSARQRHIDALKNSAQYLASALEQLDFGKALELVAEDLRCAQQALEEITGVYRADDLLGEIFSSFCIGK